MPQIRLKRMNNITDLCQRGRQDIRQACKLGLDMLLGLQQRMRTYKSCQCACFVVLQHLQGALRAIEKRLHM